MDWKRLQPLLTGFLALGWLLVALLGYIYLHKPFSAQELAGILLAVWRTSVALAILSLAGGLGLLTPICRFDLPSLSLATLSAALGLGLLSTALLVIGATIGFNSFLWVLFLIMLVVLRKQVATWWRYCSTLSQLWKDTRGFVRIIVILTAIILICQYIVALAPPLKFDALTYHLAIPKAYLQAERISYQPDNMFWGMPEQVEMLYTFAMSLGGAETATALGWWIGVLTLAGLAGFVEKIYNRETAWVTVASLLCGSGLVSSLSSSNVEWSTMLFGLAMSLCLILWASNQEETSLILAGVFAGLALSTKYTAGVALLAGYSVVILFQKPFLVNKISLNLLTFGGAALVISLPWWIKNALATGNPFYPLLFPAGAMDAIRLDLYQFSPTAQDWSRLILLPWQITVWGVDGGEGFSASIGPLLLGLSLLTLLSWRQQTPEQRLMLKAAGTMLMMGMLIWAFASQFSGLLIQTRLFLTVFPIWALLCAGGYATLTNLSTEKIRFNFIAGGLVTLALSFSAYPTLTGLLKSGALLAVLNPEAQARYLENNLGGYASVIRELVALPGTARILMLWETRGFGCLPRCDSDEIIDRWSHDWRTYGSPAAILQAWKTEGYGYLLINQAGASFVRENDENGPTVAERQGLSEILRLLRLEKTVGNYEIYALP